MADIDDVVAERVEGKLRESARDLTHIQKGKKLYTINKLALRGYPTRQIAAHPEVNLPDATVVSMLRSIKAEWMEMASEVSVQLRARELAKLDHIEEEAWDAWERSKENKRRDQVNAEIAIDKSGKSKRTPRVSRTVQEERTGDPRYLDIVFRCIDKRVRILGILNEETRVLGNGATGEVAALSIRLERYRGVLNDGFVASPGGIASHHDSGESVDTERPAREAGTVLDLDESQWRTA